MDFYTWLVFLHIVGTVLGVGGATFAEIFIVKAMRDGIVNPEETDYLRSIYAVLRIGFFLTIISGFSFLYVYRITGNEELLYQPKLWAKLTVIVAIAVNAMLIHIRAIPLSVGSAVALVSWYTAMFLGVWRTLPFGYFEIVLTYAVIVVAAIPILTFIRKQFGVKI